MSPNKVFIISVLAVLILAVPVGAKPENIVMGPYKVSFDMGDVGDYTVNLKSPSEGENFYGTSYTSYDATINGTSQSSVHLVINDYSIPVMNDVGEAIKSGMESISYACGEPTTINREIDGKPGTLGLISCSGSSEFITFYMVGYPLGYYPKNNTTTSIVLMSSTYPWDKGTSDLVKTIHVEKA